MSDWLRSSAAQMPSSATHKAVKRGLTWSPITRQGAWSSAKDVLTEEATADPKTQTMENHFP